MMHPENTCPECDSQSIFFYEELGFYHCNNCGYDWAYDCDDPDYEEFEPSAVAQIFGYAQQNDGKYINPIPAYYEPPIGIPLNWRAEQSGKLRDAVMRYWDYRVNKTDPPNEGQIFLIKCYLEHYINAPCWLENSTGKLTQLRNTVRQLDSCEKIRNWLKDAMDICLDPL